MNHIKTISPPEWMKTQSTIKVMRALGGDLKSPQAMFVGGCVRNLLMNIPVIDIDIATIHTPDIVLKLLGDNGIKAIPTGIDHGTITGICDGEKFEITTLRKDVDTDGRHAVVAYTQNWVEDAKRRDFTMNTMLCSIHGDVFDPKGKDMDDLKHGRVVFVGDADQRIKEDYLRILRFFRFYGAYGKGSADDRAIKAIRANADKLYTLSKERITQEFLKILTLENAADILSLMLDCEVLKDLGKDYSKDDMARLCDIQNRFDAQDVLSRLLMFCGFDCAKAFSALSLSNAQKRQMDMILKCLDVLNDCAPKNIRAAIYEFGNDCVIQSYFLKNKDIDENIVALIKEWQAPAFPITGADLMAKGYVQGEELGVKLKSLEREWVESDFEIVPSF